MKKLVLLVTLLLPVACGTTRLGGGSGSEIVPSLPPGHDVPHWDHFCAFSEGGGAQENTTQLLDQASARGWELVNFSGGLFCFKRPAARPAPEPLAPQPEPQPEPQPGSS